MSLIFKNKFFFNEDLKKSLATIIENIGRIFLPALLILELTMTKLYKNKIDRSHNFKRNNIIILGGNFLNKGSQAMTFTLIDQIKKKFPNRKIILFSALDFKKNKKEIYNFQILPWTHELRIKLSGSLHQFLVFYYNKFKNLENLIKNVILETEIIIDISGYNLSSQMGQGWLAYILDIIIAKKYSISYYIFPQSIGPFNFSLKYRFFFYPLAKFYLKYPKKIFVRENDGLRYIRQFTKNNVEKASDIVLQNDKYNLDNIFNEHIKFKEFSIKANSVGIIPNSRVFERANQEKIYKIYYLIINKLIESGKTIYVFRHSFEDSEICKNIKNLFTNNIKVKLIPDDLNVFEIENIIKKFDFIIASRYHAIIHSYKLGIPALVIGWAVKYEELMELFNQSTYYFNIKNQIKRKDLINKLDIMLKNYRNEKIIIITKFNDLLEKKESCFNILNKNL